MIRGNAPKTILRKVRALQFNPLPSCASDIVGGAVAGERPKNLWDAEPVRERVASPAVPLNPNSRLVDGDVFVVGIDVVAPRKSNLMKQEFASTVSFNLVTRAHFSPGGIAISSQLVRTTSPSGRNRLLPRRAGAALARRAW
jgi:hypothetical protein